MAHATCSIEGCPRQARTRGWCDMHYIRWMKHGDPLVRLSPPGRTARPLAERFWEKVEMAEGCWVWRGYINPKSGYGSIAGGPGSTKGIPAHRVAYEMLVGPIPQGLHIDHLCRNRSCVNPAHMEPVTPGENVLRGVGRSAQNARKTHCKHGHEFTSANTYIYRNGTRKCRACAVMWERAYSYLRHLNST